MAEIFYWEAIRRAHDEEMARDPLVFAMGDFLFHYLDIGFLQHTGLDKFVAVNF